MRKNFNWRQDPGILRLVKYKRKFAYLPTKCEDGESVWFCAYYTCTEVWHTAYTHTQLADSYSHYDPSTNITEAEYLVRKLTEGF